MKKGIGLGVIAVLAIGCGSKQDSGVDKVTNAESHVKGNVVSLAEATLTLPDGWKVFDLSQADFAKGLDAWVASDPSVRATAEGVKAISNNKAIRLFAFDVVNSKPGFSDNVNVLVLDQGVPKSIDDLVAATQSQIASLPNGKVIDPFRREKVGSNDYAYGLFSMKGPGGQDLACYSYSTLHDGKNVTFTFTCVVANQDSFGKAARTVMDSVRLQ